MNLVLIAMIVLPVIGALLVILAADALFARLISLATTLATLVLAIVVVANFETRDATTLTKEVLMSPQMTSHAQWLTFNTAGGNEASIDAYLGIDGISLWLVALTALLMVSAVLVSWRAVNERVVQFHVWLLLLETGMLGVFCAFDLILFYVFFEFTLIPLFFLIGIWGGPQRRYAAGKFFIYTLTGSLLSLVGLVALVLTVHHFDSSKLTFSIPELAQIIQQQLATADATTRAQWNTAQVLIFLALFAGFAIKVPLFPFHTWLPLAHVEAPTAGSVLLAGVLLKLGTYGFLRLALPLLPLAVRDTGVPLVAALSVAGIIYGALCALGQTDMKRLVAYSSVSHLGFCMLGLFALNVEGITGGTLQMINHGLSTGALFLLVGMIYERLHTRELTEMGGLASRLPIFSCFLIFACLSSMGLPGLNGFIGEVLSLIGMFKAKPIYAVIGAAGIVLGAWYLLNMLQLALFGPRRESYAHAHEPIPDLKFREIFALAPIAVMCVVIGVFPQYFIEKMAPDIESIASIYANDEPNPGVAMSSAVVGQQMEIKVVGAAYQNVMTAARTIAPELGIVAAATLLVLLGAFLPNNTEQQKRSARALCLSLTTVVLLIALLFTLGWRGDNGLQPAAAGATATQTSAGFTPAFLHDSLARAIEPTAILLSLGLLVLMRERLNEKYPAEHLACLLFIIAGVILVASANDLIALFVSLELVSIPTYVLLYLSRPNRPALESTTKYFLLSIFSSAFLLYGLSFFLGSAGSTNFAAVAASLREPTGVVSVGMLQVALAMVIAGLGFRIAAVPFHFYAPDVFQGTTLPTAALLAIVPKIAGFVALVRLAWSVVLSNPGAVVPFDGLERYGIVVIAVLAFITMTVGNLLALLQTDLRRLFAYSSVAHAGYMLVGLAVPGATASPNGAQAVLFYLLAYSLMTLGAFGVLLLVQRRDREVHNVADLAGLGITHPAAALLLTVFMLGLTGLPPTVGFWGKFNLLLVAWNSGQLGMRLLAIGLAINAAVAAWYYLRLVKTAYLDAPADGMVASEERPSATLVGAMSVCALATIGFFCFPNALMGLLSDIH